MDCPCLLGRTLNGLAVKVKRLVGVNCLSVRLAVCLFDSPAALYLFVSAHICSPPPILNLLPCSKPFTSSHLPHLGLPHLSDKDLATPRPKQEVLLALSFWHVQCVTLISCAVFFFVAVPVSLTVRTATAMELTLKYSGYFLVYFIWCTTFFNRSFAC